MHVRIKPLLFFLLVICMALSCDMPSVIVIENKTNSNVIYKYYEKVLDNKIDTVNIELSSLSGKNKVELIFGFGQMWTDERIKEYLDAVLCIELMTFKDTILLNDKAEMFNYFKDRRKGLFKQKIKIIFE